MKSLDAHHLSQQLNQIFLCYVGTLRFVSDILRIIALVFVLQPGEHVLDLANRKVLKLLVTKLVPSHLQLLKLHQLIYLLLRPAVLLVLFRAAMQVVVVRALPRTSSNDHGALLPLRPSF